MTGTLTAINKEQYNKNRIYGIRRGIVEYNVDPLKIGRCKVRVPELHSTEKSIETKDLPWAYPMHHYGGFHDGGSFYVPPVGATVLVQFEMGDPEYPFYGGTFWKIPPEVLELNTKTSKETGKILPERPISMGQWFEPIGPETPQEVLETPYEPTTHIVHKCHAFGTKIFTKDLNLVPIEDLKVGDSLLAFDEFPVDGTKRKWKESIVTSAEHDKEECFEIVLENGHKITTTKDHLHLTTKETNRRYNWTLTKNLVIRENTNGGGGSSKFVRVLETNFGNITEYERGYISGMYDADGSFGLYTSKSNGFKKGDKSFCGHSAHLVLGQVSNICLKTVIQILEKANYKIKVHEAKGKSRSKKTTWQRFFYLHILGGKNEILRFLCQFRPPRLLERYQKDIAKLGQMSYIDCPKIISVNSVGIKNIVRLGTTSLTYIADGYATHNSAKGHTVLMEDRDGFERFRIIDRSGQELRFSSPITEGMNDGNASQRGTKSVFSGDTPPYEDYAGGATSIELLGTSGQGIKILSKENSEYIEIVSKDDTAKATPDVARNKISLLIGGGLGVLEISGVKDSVEKVKLVMDLHSGSIELKSASSITLKTDIMTLVSSLLQIRGDVSIEGDLNVRGSSIFSGEVVGINEAKP